MVEQMRILKVLTRLAEQKAAGPVPSFTEHHSDSESTHEKYVEVESSRGVECDCGAQDVWNNAGREKEAVPHYPEDTGHRSRLARWKADETIHGFGVDSVPIDMNEMAYGGHYFLNPKARLPLVLYVVGG